MADGTVASVLVLVEPQADLPPERWSRVTAYEGVYGAFRGLACFERLAGIEFGLHAAKEALYGRIAPAVAFATHGAKHASLVQQTTIGVRRILAAAIGVMHQAGPWPPVGDRHQQAGLAQQR